MGGHRVIAGVSAVIACDSRRITSADRCCSDRRLPVLLMQCISSRNLASRASDGELSKVYL